MPASKMLCVKSCLESGIIGSATDLTFVERSPRVAKLLERNLHKDDAFPDARQASLFKCDVSDIRELPQGPRSSEDYLFLDYNGTLTAESSQWLVNTMPGLITDDADICFTFQMANRNNRFAKDVYSLFSESSVLKAGKDIANDLAIYDNDRVATLTIAVLGLLSPYRVNVINVGTYYDTQSMMFLRCKLKGRSSNDSSLTERIMELVNNMPSTPPTPRKSGSTPKSKTASARTKTGDTQMSKVANKRSDAANKAWETRRKNQLDAKRSDAGKKAWATRRRNEAKAAEGEQGSKRGDAARKAWKTRRAS